MRALSSYNALCLCHKFERAQFYEHFIKEIVNLPLVCIVELYIRHVGIFKNSREVWEALDYA